MDQTETATGLSPSPTPEPSDAELRAKMEQLREQAKAQGLDRLFSEPVPVDVLQSLASVNTRLVDDLALVAASTPAAADTWEPTCVRCGADLGYVTRRNSYVAGRTECGTCRAGSIAERLAASGISFREVDKPLSALRNCDPDGKPYGEEYERWLAFLRRFAALRPGERMKPPFAFAYGSNGVGKSAGAERALRDAIVNGCAGRVVTFRELIRQVVDAYGRKEAHTEDVIRLYAGIHLLVIQEVGMEDPTEHNYGLFFDFVDTRWRMERPTIFTSNYAPESNSLGAKMTERSGDGTKMHAILDRIRGGVGENVFLLRGKSWRGREAA